MNEAFESVSSVAVYGSLLASLLLGCFMFVQAGVDRARRGAYLLFGGAWILLFAIDGLHPFLVESLGAASYELLRVCWCGLYLATLLGLFDHGLRRSVGLGVVLAVIGAVSWLLYPSLATTITFPLAFGTASLVHAMRVKETHAYASSVLAALGIAMAILCANYLACVETGKTATLLGYAHYAMLQLLAVFFGWIHVPRELRGQSPVKVELRRSALLCSGVIIAEIAVVAGLLGQQTYLFVIANLFQLAAVLLFYFERSHQLVIYTESVEKALAERTQDLMLARERLSVVNADQKVKLEEQAEELKSKAAVIDRQRRLELAAETAGQAAHDIQNLISPVLIQVGEIEREADRPDFVKDRAAKIREEIEDLLALNGHLLALSRRGRLEMRPVSIEELLLAQRNRFPHRQLELKLERELWISGSWSQLSRAISNLIANALDVAPAETVRVASGRRHVETTQRCHLGFLGPGEYVAISVTDCGPGIPGENLEKIFEPFFSSKSGPVSSGSGLGLSIVAAVTDDLRGVLDLETGSQGTTFTLYLPLIPPPSAEPLDLASLSGNETVLVIDDDSSILTRYKTILEAAGYVALTAGSGPEALLALQMHDAELLLLDLKMPGMSGIETYFNAIQLRPSIRAVVHSSYVSEAEAQSLKELGVSEFLDKPAGKIEVLSKLRSVFATMS